MYSAMSRFWATLSFLAVLRITILAALLMVSVVNRMIRISVGDSVAFSAGVIMNAVRASFRNMAMMASMVSGSVRAQLLLIRWMKLSLVWCRRSLAAKATQVEVCVMTAPVVILVILVCIITAVAVQTKFAGTPAATAGLFIAGLLPDDARCFKGGREACCHW